MNEIGIVICNYNKKKYLGDCIESILKSSNHLYDIYVIDNASTDGSVEFLKSAYGDKITIIESKKNRGGSGGFHLGLKIVAKKNYSYLMCVDNDIIMDQNNIEILYSHLKENPSVGMVGSRVMYLDNPAMIQSMGASIDFDNYSFRDNYRDVLLTNDLPTTIECDYVPACSMMVRASLLDKVGLIPKDYFLYWDDIEWGYNFRHLGYSVVCLRDAYILHKGNFKNTSTLSKYYMNRNRIYFFSTHLSEEKKEDFCKVYLKELFRIIYACKYKGDLNLIKTLIFSFDDAMNKKRGEAEAWKIFQRNKINNRLEEILLSNYDVYISIIKDDITYNEVINKIKSINPNINVHKLINSNENNIKNEVEFSIKQISENKKVIFMPCAHVFDVEAFDEGNIYIDRWGNIIETREDFLYSSQFNKNLELFLDMFYEVMLRSI